MKVAFHDFIVPGLDVLIGDPDILNPLPDSKKRAEIFYIPEGYVRRVIDFYHEQSGRGDACRELTRRFGTILAAIKDSDTDSYQLENGTLIVFVPASEYKAVSGSKEQAIATAIYLRDSGTIANPSFVAIMTGSDQLAALALLKKIDVVHINPDVYTGRRKVYLPLNYSSLWYSNHKITQDEWAGFFPEEPPLQPNEFVEFAVDNHGQIDRSFQNIGRFDADKGALVPLKYFRFSGAKFKRIYPKTAGQAMLLEALLAPPEEIPLVVVSGLFGTGKTFLTVAAGFYGVTVENNYERLFICPRDGALGKEIGFVPGDSTEKTLVKARPIIDNLREVLKLTELDSKNPPDSAASSSGKRSCFNKKVENYLASCFEFEPVINMGGRSLSDSFIVYDEFQDMERYQAKALLTRIGNGSKIVVSGDPTQVTNPHLNRTSNGLSYSASKLAGKPEAAIITLTQDEIVRSSAALAIARYFS